jgi:hypothetical protein
MPTANTATTWQKLITSRTLSGPRRLPTLAEHDTVWPPTPTKTIPSPPSLEVPASTFRGMVEVLAQGPPPETGRILLHALTGDKSEDEVIWWAAMWGFESE